MYAPGLGISENPFKLGPDPGRFFTASTHECAYRGIMDCIKQRKKLLLLSGEAGTGKTTLLLKVMQDVGESARVLYFPYTNLSPDALLGHVCRQLGITDTESRDGGGLKTLQDFFAQRQHTGELTVLLIDEAQNLDQEALTQLSELPNIAAAETVQVILAGHPSLEERLKLLIGTGERSATCCQLNNLDNEEVVEYLRLRLRQVGCLRDDLFTEDTVAQLIGLTKGNPRLINIVCGNALAVADRNARTRLSGELIEVGAVMGAKAREPQQGSGPRVETILARMGAEPPAPTSPEVPASADPVEPHEVQLLQAMQEDIADGARPWETVSPGSGRARVLIARLSILSANLRSLTSFGQGRHEDGNVTKPWAARSQRVVAHLAWSIQRAGERIWARGISLGSRIADFTHEGTMNLMTHSRTRVSGFAGRAQAGVEHSAESTAVRWRHPAGQVATRIRDSLEWLWQIGWLNGVLARRPWGRHVLAELRNRLAASGVRNILVIAGLSAVVVSAWLVAGPRTQPLEESPIASNVSEFGRFSTDELRNRVNELTYQLERSLGEQERLTRELADVREERDWLATRLRGVASEDTGAVGGLGNNEARTKTELLQDQELAKATDYTVRKGDTLWAIALELGISVANLAAWNGIQANDVLRVGQRLAISARPQRQSPTAADRDAQSLRYVVQRGDSLYQIAKRFDVTIAQLRSWNNLAPDRHLQPHQQLTVFVGNPANASL
jgi:general secretion pathway protein A